MASTSAAPPPQHPPHPQPPATAAPKPKPATGTATATGAATGTALASVGGAESNVCHKCQKAISTSQFIRVGSFKFHKNHFTCAVCECDLHGQKFHHRDGRFYCQHDMSKFYHTCRTCKQKIAQTQVIQAFGYYYHPEHFVCTTCSKPFDSGKYYENGGQPYCEEHYFSLRAEKCVKCQQPVKENEVVRVQAAVYHSACLRCQHCDASLAGTGTIYQKETHAYCKQDYLNLFCKRCTACGEHVLKGCVTVNEENYHPDCLLCSVCQRKLDKYICVGGHLRCSEHAAFACDKYQCSVCGLLIEADVVLAVGKKVHEACFVCSLCKTKLTKTGAKVRDGKLCCAQCILKKDEFQYPQLGRVRNASEASAGPKQPKPVPDPRRMTLPGGVGQAPGDGERKHSLDKVHEDDDEPSPAASPREPDPAAPTRPPAAAGAGSSSGSSAGTGSKQTSRKEPGASATRPRIEWRKGELIGKGSFGKVFMGMNVATGELIAVKQVRLSTAEEHEQAAAIQSEITLMENLRHPNIVALLGTQRTGTKLSILMEYVPGKSLDSLLEKFGAFSERVIRSYTKQLLSALAYCHANRVVHRDIKGKNILVDTQGRLKLADFGSAKKFSNVMSKDAPSVSYNYTPLWTAPEVLMGDYNSKVDIWSLGCVIIEMASAKPPWSEHNFENPFRALYHIGNSDSIPKIPEYLSEEAKDFIKKCLQRNPEKRLSAEELLRERWLDGIDDDSSSSSSSSSTPAPAPAPRMGMAAPSGGTHDTDDESDDDDAKGK